MTQRTGTAFTFTQGITNGGIKIADDATPAPATTAKPAATTTAKPAAATTTTAKPAAPAAPKTGVPGVGLVAAGLVVAAGAAFVLRKKED